MPSQSQFSGKRKTEPLCARWSFHVWQVSSRSFLQLLAQLADNLVAFLPQRRRQPHHFSNILQQWFDGTDVPSVASSDIFLPGEENLSHIHTS